MVPRESIKFVPIFWIVGYEYVYVPYLRGPPAPRCRDRTRTADARVTLRPPLPHHKEAAHRGLLGPGRQMRLLTGPAVFTKRYASFTPGLWLHEWLTRACMSCLAFFGPTPSQAPQAPWEHGPQHSLVQHLPRKGYRGSSDRPRSSCATRPAASPRTLTRSAQGSTYTPPNVENPRNAATGFTRKWRTPVTRSPFSGESGCGIPWVLDIRTILLAE